MGEKEVEMVVFSDVSLAGICWRDSILSCIGGGVGTQKQFWNWEEFIAGSPGEKVLEF